MVEWRRWELGGGSQLLVVWWAAVVTAAAVAQEHSSRRKKSTVMLLIGRPTVKKNRTPSRAGPPRALAGMCMHRESQKKCDVDPAHPYPVAHPPTQTHLTVSAPHLGRAGSRAERAAAPRGRSAGQLHQTRRRSPRPDSRPAAQDVLPLPTPLVGCCCCCSPQREELRRRAAGGCAVTPRGLGTGKHVAGRRCSCKLEGELPPQASSHSAT
jgi:hypothetical protein